MSIVIQIIPGISAILLKNLTVCFDAYFNHIADVQISVLSLKIGYPTKPKDEYLGTDQRMFPRHAKACHVTYEAPLLVTFGIRFLGVDSILTKEIVVGQIPVMVKSKRCNLDGLSPREMVKQGEDIDEPGGYFVVSGNERIIRHIIVPRSNYPMAIKSENNKSKNVLFTEYSVMMRGQCSDDGCTVTNLLYLTINQRCIFRVFIKGSVLLLPLWLLLRAAMPSMTDDELKQKLIQDTIDNEELTIYYHRYFLDFTLREPLLSDIDFEENRYLHKLGCACWNQVNQYLHPGATFEECGQYFLKNYVAVQAKTNAEKFETLLFMYKKLVKLSRGEIQAENYDSFAFQELALPGQLYSCILKESLYNALNKIKTLYTTEINAFKRYLQGTPTDKKKRHLLEIDVNKYDSSLLLKKLLISPELFNYCIDKVAPDIPKKLHYFLATGNAASSHFEITQNAGYTVVADRINYHRFISHFRSVHRGNIFTKMRSTEVRKLLGETWGFLCPVHTPDGAPCGLLLHLTQQAVPVTDPFCENSTAVVKNCLRQCGYNSDFVPCGRGHGNMIPIIVDGVPICSIPALDSHSVLENLRNAKLNGNFGMRQHFEIVALPDIKGMHTSILIMTYPGRVIRPVKSAKTGVIEWIGAITQLWSTIAVSEEEMKLSHSLLKQSATETQGSLSSFGEIMEKYRNIRNCDLQPVATLENVPVEYEYVEVKQTAILSLTAALTPFSNHNQSPRNMYQCQMLKQSMGVPYHCEAFRSDVKAYRLLFPQKPIVSTEEFRKMKYEDYPTGANAIVAIIAHTGFDMEDAMIINKASLERGAFHGCIYKTKVIDATPPNASMRDGKSYYFHNVNNSGGKIIENLDHDGLPYVGQRVRNGSIICRIESREKTRGQVHITERIEKYHDEEAIVDQVTLIGVGDKHVGERSSSTGVKTTRVAIKFRITRNPVVGDKFASRHGQKGILSMAWPAEDMPFLESGITPDIIFNPHGLPSRMTVGKLIECMAGKSGAVHGRFHDATCFKTFPRQKETGNKWIDQCGIKGWEERGKKYHDELQYTDQDDVVDYFGKTLLHAGYEYYGTEPMYCGTLGIEIKTHIFVGCIFYQRLRHMVSDKFQVRATGPVDAVTKQPVKGRKNHGGIRFGEMERDALIAHGTSALLQDRLMHCSDAHTAFVCPKCGSLLSATISSIGVNTKDVTSKCKVCNVNCKLVTIPYVLRYVANELASINVGIKLHLSQLGMPINL
ncbi:bifunctional RNA polymerase [Babesia duncani]|uniref:DNA-directed RNA polymerase subunit beta n=1 Tax=Babesia duncani TaxID=323732 RepID=A0AAD9PPD1_9APIC|nr:bifunctional RNA polymerase [Babesia duncani]